VKYISIWHDFEWYILPGVGMAVIFFSWLVVVAVVETVVGKVVEGCASRQQAWYALSHGSPNSKFWKTHSIPMEPDISPSLHASQQSCKS